MIEHLKSNRGFKTRSTTGIIAPLVSCLHEWGAQRHNLFQPHPLGPCGRIKRSYIIKFQNSITKSISNIFKPDFVCLLTNQRYKTYQMRFSFGRLGHAPGVGLWGSGGLEGSKGALSWYEKLTWESAHTWILKILCYLIVWSITLILMVRLSFYAIPLLIYDVMNDITTIP